MLIPDREVDRRITRKIIASTKSGFIGQVLVLLFALTIFYGYVPLSALLLWSGLHLLNFLYRLKIVDEYLHAGESPEKRKRSDLLFRRYILSLVFTSALWTAMLIFFPMVPETYGFLIYAIVIVLTYGSTISIGPLTPVFLTFVLPMNLALMAQLLLHGGRIYVAAALFLPVALFFAAKAAKMHLYDYTALLIKESQAHRLRERFEHLASHDALTGIPNRSKFLELFDRALREAKGRHGALALFFIDLDRFKEINDTYGHHIGDRVLEIIGKRLKASMRESDIPARLAGDEFVVLVRNVSQKGELAAIAQKIRDTIASPIVTGKVRITVEPSIGIARYPEDGDDLQTLMMHADSAMYRSKKERKAYLFFTPGLPG